MTNQCKKGKRVELSAAHWLKDCGVSSARRTQQHNGAEGKSDVIAEVELPHWHIESKGTKFSNLTPGGLWKWYEQLTTDCPLGMDPVIFWQANGKDMMHIFKLDTIKQFPLNNPMFVIATECPFYPHEVMRKELTKERVINSLFVAGPTKKESTFLVAYEIEPGVEFYFMQGEEGLAMMLALEERRRSKVA